MLVLAVGIITALIINGMNPSFAVAMIIGCLILFVSFLSLDAVCVENQATARLLSQNQRLEP